MSFILVRWPIVVQGIRNKEEGIRKKDKVALMWSY
jgi:hypothetical protein